MQIDIKHPHDSIFKNVFDDIDNTKDLLKAYLPTDLVREIDFETMKHAPTEKRDMELYGTLGRNVQVMKLNFSLKFFPNFSNSRSSSI